MPRGSPFRPLKFKRIPHHLMSQPCIVPVSHKPDDKGYVRIVPRDGKGGRARPLHRLAYLAKYGPQSIPDGWEIDHICKNRPCCNRSHLRALTVSDHKRVTASERYADRNAAARDFWEYYRPTNSELAAKFGVKPKTAEGWVRRWKTDPHT